MTTPADESAEERPGHLVRTRAYRSGVLEKEDFPIALLSDYREQGFVLWADLCSPSQHELRDVAEEFGLDQLAVEDAGEHRQRPKLDRYPTHAFLNMYAVDLDQRSGELEMSELSAFLLPDALITVRKDDRLDITQVTRRWDASPDLAKHGVSFLLHGLVDYVVDGYFEVVEELDDNIEAAENLLFDTRRPNIEIQRRAFELRKSLVTLRRVVLPMREVVNSLIRRDLGLVDPEMLPYYQDVYDQVLRATEWTESLRDLVSTILETNLTIQSNRLNVITKKVTSWGAIIAVPTLVTGFYGMNVPYPGVDKPWGFWTSVILMAVLVPALYGLFKKIEWL